MDTVLVVVIAGVIIAAIAVATLSGGPKPATTPRRRRRAPGRVPTEPPPSVAPARPAAGTPALEPWVFPERHDDLPLPDDPVDPPADLDVRSRWLRLRSAAILAVTVVLLGSLAAGLLGAAVLVGYRALDGALG